MTIPTFTLRTAMVADLAHLHDLDARLVGEAELPGAVPEDFARFQTAFTAQMLGDPGSHVIIAIGADDAMLGYIQMKAAPDEVLGCAIGQIGIIAVSERASGKGIGRALMAAAEGWAREQGLPALVLDVFASNRTARAFYATLDFAEDSLRLRKVL